MRNYLAIPLLILAACAGSEANSGAALTPTMNEVSNEHADEAAEPSPEPVSTGAPVDLPGEATAVATFGAGCFWCVEAVLLQVDGVESVVSGYMGGQTDNPTYKDICTGTTGHAEVVQVTYNPTVLPYKDLLDWFFRLHDPTTLNRQGGDRGTQYRSAIFFHTQEHAAIAREMIAAIGAAEIFDDPIVTEVTPVSTFYLAEAYHQDYYSQNARQGYCRAVIMPKLKKLGLKY
jgi:peptide-methionine (S)-S-oxide reductase